MIAYPCWVAHGLALPLPKHEPARPVRSAGWVRVALTALVALSLGSACIAALDPNRPWVKRRVRSLVQSSTGFDVDYRSLRLRPLSGLEVEDLVVHSAPDVAAFAPEMLRAGRMDVLWSPSSLLGHGPPLQQVALQDVVLTLVVDDQGLTSLAAIGWPSKAPSTPVPFSRRAGELLAPRPPAALVDVTRAVLTLIRVREDRAVGRDRVDGLSASVAAELGERGWRLRAATRSNGAPVEIQGIRERDGSAWSTARARLSFDADLTASTLRVACDLAILEQSLVPQLGGGEWHAEARARFDPTAGRTTIDIGRLSAPAGAGATEASIEVPDEGPPLVRHASGDVDLARVLAWAPAGLVPVSAAHARVHFRVDSAVLGLPPSLSDGGAVQVEAYVSGVEVRTGRGTIDIDQGHLVLDGRPAIGSDLVVRASEQIDGLHFDGADVHLDARDVGVDLEGRRGGDLGMSARIGAIDASVGTGRAYAGSVALDARTRLEARAPYAGQVDLTASNVNLFGDGKHLVRGAPARMRVGLQGVVPNARDPIASRGAIRASIDSEDSRVSMDAVKRADAVDYTLRVATNLNAVRALVSSLLPGAAGWDGAGVAIRSSGRLDRVGSRDPVLRQEASIDIDRPTLGRVSARALSVALRSHGTSVRHHAEAMIDTTALTIDGTAASDDALGLSLDLDRSTRSMHLIGNLRGRASASLDIAASFDRSRRAVVYDLAARLAEPHAVGPLLARVHGLDGFDLSRLGLDFAARGTLLGAVSDVGYGGAIELAPDPARTAAIEGAADLRVEGLRWARGDEVLELPSLVWHGHLSTDGTRRTLSARADADGARLALGPHELDVAGIADEASVVVTGDLRNPEIQVAQRAAIRAVQQDVVPEYPVRDVAITFVARRDTEGLLQVSGATVHNGGGGTTLTVEGAVDLGSEQRRRLSLTADVAQELEPLSALPARLSGTGKVTVAAALESPDLSLFRTRLDVKITAPHLTIGGAGVEAEGVDGDIPIRIVFDLGEHGLRVRRDERRNPYAMLRFADQHPLFVHTGFLSVTRMTTPLGPISPFIGNLAVEQNVASLRQFEMGVRGGWLAGECALHWDGARSMLEAHLRANGLQSSHGEPFDGNVAVVVTASDRMIQGRAEISRMGQRHLLDLLDMEDPLRVDTAMNRIRRALAFGYPDRVRVVFDSGFANARVELGGLAGLMSFDELRGIPTGPLVDRLLQAVVDGRARP